MSLQVWLPLCGNTNNQGLANVNVINNGATVNTAGKIGSCYYFLRSTPNYLKIDNCFTTSGNGISMAFWIKIPSNASGNNQIIHIGNGAGWNNNRCTCFIYTGKSTIVFCCGDGNGTTSTYSTMYNCESSAITLNVWTHVACVYTPGTMQIYLNGVLDKTYTTSIVPSFTNVSYIGVAAAPNGGEPATIYLNDVRIYDHCLSQAEVYEIAKGKMIHLKLDNGGFGQENLAIGSQGVWASNLGSADGSRAEYRAKSLGQAFPVTSGTKVRLSFDLHMEVKTARTASEMKLIVYNTNNKGPHYGWIYQEILAGRALAVGDIIDEHFSFTGTVNDKSDSTLLVDWIEFYSVYGTNNWYSISNLHIELGEVETPWAPHSTDAFYISSQLGTQFDCSGYRHDAVTNAITHSPNTARYVCSSVFNGSSSYVKVNDTTWMADRMPAMTINLWAKNSAWNANTHFFSCTEAGGFNTESGNSGYLRFPVHVYTSATEASVAYKYDSQELKLADIPTDEWVMLTWVYDSFGTRTYINGELHHTYINTSYGIHFATGARLFLGCEANAANPYQPWYNGQMSDFRIYATAMSQDDVRLLYHTSGFVDNQGNVFAGELREV